MTCISLSILNQEQEVRKAKIDDSDSLKELTITGKDFVCLAARDCQLQDGDVIQVCLDTPNTYLMVKLDATLDSSLIYVPEQKWTFPIIKNENAIEARAAYRLETKKPYISVRIATKEEIKSYRNWALNPHDLQHFTGAYPHASANVETRNDATFFACNAIDGTFANLYHGPYPYQSWGINQQLDAALKIEFGREVLLDKVILTLRADFPHDNYWQQVTLKFSDGTHEVFKTVKTEQRQSFTFAKRAVEWVILTELIQADEPSPFPALTQIELFGQNK